jgi:hypothetical protein
MGKFRRTIAALTVVGSLAGGAAACTPPTPAQLESLWSNIVMIILLNAGICIAPCDPPATVGG